MVIYTQNRLLSTSKNATCYWLSGRFEAHFPQVLRQAARQQGRIDPLQAHVIDILVSLVHDLLHISTVFKSCQENSCCLQSTWQTPLDRTAAIVEG